MLVKQKDDVEPAILALEVLLVLKTLTGQQRERIEDEIENIRAGARGEKEAAYHIDFKLKDSKNWVMLHDLRLEHNGRAAQIDHVLINRRFDVFVIESKNLKTAVRVNANDEFEVKTRWGWKGMASPVEQNKRHIEVVRELIADEKLTPSRLGFQIRPKFFNWVLLAPECNLVRGKSEEATILKMDMFDRGLEKFINNDSLADALSLTKVCSTQTVTAFAEKLVSFHKPIVFDYATKFGITEAQRFSAPVATANGSSSSTRSCEKCQTPVESKVVAFCQSHEKRFGGKVLCRTCQLAFTVAKPVAESSITAPGPTCHECKSPVDAKVVAFCRFNSARFSKKVLCRTCQSTSVLSVSS